ncbi:hypothetical protein KFE25_006151 [Diacronema lutheri]|uniref:Tetratricopeptide repeat protein n=2 Tax=Diacronema lutheri TaxID=2081491 RepID=A0A8J5XVD9_DIALT|nr:hypothetical protein KFE25_006151 [Diacronema lutheri]
MYRSRPLLLAPEGPDLSEEWSRFARNATNQYQNLAADIAFAHLADAELDPKRKALWEQLRRATELDAVQAARATLAGRDAPADGSTDEQPVPEWRRLSRALSELQYWLIATGNQDAETALLDVIQRAHATERSLAIEADGLLRKAWSVHGSAPTNLRMEAARSLLRNGKAKEAALAFAALAGELSPPWAEAHRWQGKVHNLALGDAPGAIAAYERALSLSPRNYPLLFELGALLVRDATAEAQLGGPRAAGSAERASRGAQLLGRAVELNPLLAPKVARLLGEADDD